MDPTWVKSFIIHSTVFVGIFSERNKCIVPICNHYFPISINQMISSLLAKNVQKFYHHIYSSLGITRKMFMPWNF